MQQAILHAVSGGGVHPLLHIAKTNGHDISSLPVRQSFNRAARTLSAAGRIEIWTLKVPTAINDFGVTAFQHVSVVRAPGQGDQLTDDDWNTCRQECHQVFFGNQLEREAEVERMIEILKMLIEPEPEPDPVERAAEIFLRVFADRPHELDRDKVMSLVDATPDWAGLEDAIVDRVMALVEEDL